MLLIFLIIILFSGCSQKHIIKKETTIIRDTTRDTTAFVYVPSLKKDTIYIENKKVIFHKDTINKILRVKIVEKPKIIKIKDTKIIEKKPKQKGKLPPFVYSIAVFLALIIVLVVLFR